MDKADLIFILSIVTGIGQALVNAGLMRRVARLEKELKIDSKWSVW
jgi:hypothetical protein